MIQTAEEVKHQLLTAWVNGEAHTIDDILKRWAESIIKEAIETNTKSTWQEKNNLEKLQEHLRATEFKNGNYTEEIDDCITGYIEKLTGHED